MIRRIIILGILGVLLRIVEHAKLILRRSRKDDSGAVGKVYAVGYVHPSLGIAALGVEWARQVYGRHETGVESALVLVVFLLAGSALRGLFSRSKPQSFSLKDVDWLCGFVLANTCGVIAFFYALLNANN